MKVGMMLPVGGQSGAPDWSSIRELAERAEASGLDSLWLADHFFYQAPDGTVHGMHDAWTLLGALAAVTSRMEIGTLVLCTSFRSPGMIANMAVTADIVSNERLVLGLGSGWHDPEYEAFGFPTDHRVGRFAEALEIVVRLLGGERVSFDGRYYQVKDAAVAPAPRRRIPVLVAAFGPRMLRLTARWADSWNTAWYFRPDEVKLLEALAAFDEALAAEGRNPGDVVRTIGIEIGDVSADEIAAVLDGLSALGCDHAIARLATRTPATVERLAEAVRLVRG